MNAETRQGARRKLRLPTSFIIHNSTLCIQPLKVAGDAMGDKIGMRL